MVSLGPEQDWDDYRGEQDVYGVVTGQFPLQILELLEVAAAPRLHHLLQTEHSRRSAVKDNHGAQLREPGGETEPSPLGSGHPSEPTYPLGPDQSLLCSPHIC